MAKPRPIAQYYGGKSEMLGFYYAHTPAHDRCVEACAGMASFILFKPSTKLDVINDTSPAVVNLFAVLRDRPRALARAVALTPYAAAEFARCRKICEAAAIAPAHDPLEYARAYLTCLRQSYSTAPGKSWSRVIAHSRRDMASSCSRWLNVPDDLLAVADRLKTVQIDNLPVDRCIEKYGRPGTLLFIDPPYLPSTRNGARAYEHEMTVEDHKRMLRAAIRTPAAVMLCGYANPLYDRNLTPERGWRREVNPVHARTNVRHDGTLNARPGREEVLWVKDSR